MDGFKGTDLGPGRGKEPLFLGRLTIYIHFPVIMFRIFERRLLLLLLFFFFSFLGLHPWDMEVPRLGVESQLQVPAPAMPYQSNVYDLYLSSW